MSATQEVRRDGIDTNMERGAVVRHTLFDRYEDALYAEVEEVVLPSVSRHQGGHAVLSHPEWDDTKNALLDNLKVALVSEEQSACNKEWEGECDHEECSYEFAEDETPVVTKGGDGVADGMLVPILQRFCSEECYEAWLEAGCPHNDDDPRLVAEW